MTTAQERLAAKRGTKPDPLAAITKRNEAYVAQNATTSPEAQEGEMVVRLHVTKIKPNPYQHRTAIDQAEIEELAKSIRVNGQNQPIGVRKKNDGYEIIFGERRWRAIQTLEDKTIDVVVRDVSDRDMIFICLSENRNRKKAFDYETYRGIKFALDEQESPEDIMERLVIDQATWYKYLSYGSLHPKILQFVNDHPACMQRNECYLLVGLFKKFGEEIPEGAVEYLIELLQMYLDKKITSRGEIGTRFKAKFAVQKHTRNRPKRNIDYSVSLGSARVGTMVKTPEEIHLTLQKSEISKDKLDELESILNSFFKIAQDEGASA